MTGPAIVISRVEFVRLHRSAHQSGATQTADRRPCVPASCRVTISVVYGTGLAGSLIYSSNCSVLNPPDPDSTRALRPSGNTVSPVLAFLGAIGLPVSHSLLAGLKNISLRQVRVAVSLQKMLEKRELDFLAIENRRCRSRTEYCPESRRQSEPSRRDTRGP